MIYLRNAGVFRNSRYFYAVEIDDTLKSSLPQYFMLLREFYLFNVETPVMTTNTFAKINRCMTVIVFTPFYPPYWKYGGTVRSIDGVVQQLIKKHNIIVMTTVDDKYWETSSVNKNDCRIIVKYYESKGSFRFSFKYLLNAIRYIRKSNVVYVNGMWSWPSVLGVLLSYVFSKEVILAPRGMLLGPALSHKTLLKKILGFVYALTSNNSRTVLHWTTYYEQHQSLMKFQKARNAIFPNTISENEIWKHVEPLPLSSLLKIVYVGRVTPIKNLESVIEAVLMVNKHKCSVMFNIVGDGDYDYVESLKTLASCSTRIIFLGHLDGEKRVEIIDKSHVGILVSKSENFGMAAAEMLARGRPVILGNNVALNEFVQSSQGGWICDEAPHAVKTKLLEVLAIFNSGRLSEHSTAARMLAQQHFKPDVATSIVDSVVNLSESCS